MILSLLITIITEGLVVIGYSHGRRKPVFPILITSIGANLITQSLLWIVLGLFFQHYLTVLLIAEVMIWIIESLLLYYIPANGLHFRESLLLSLWMNIVSFAVGWFLPG